MKKAIFSSLNHQLNRRFQSNEQTDRARHLQKNVRLITWVIASQYWWILIAVAYLNERTSSLIERRSIVDFRGDDRRDWDLTSGRDDVAHLSCGQTDGKRDVSCSIRRGNEYEKILQLHFSVKRFHLEPIIYKSNPCVQIRNIFKINFVL